jgi:flagellar basal body rod protein FlgC
MPNVAVEREMVDMLSAKSSYQANIKAIQVFKSMYNAALEI